MPRGSVGDLVPTKELAILLISCTETPKSQSLISPFVLTKILDGLTSLTELCCDCDWIGLCISWKNEDLRTTVKLHALERREKILMGACSDIEKRVTFSAITSSVRLLRALYTTPPIPSYPQIAHPIFPPKLFSLSEIISSKKHDSEGRIVYLRRRGVLRNRRRYKNI
uniref:Uncharacterized protein n=1 Tax=Romanomermis culicivorax TaxID=13658 RepID=A0A915JIQ7_ROMCU